MEDEATYPEDGLESEDEATPTDWEEDLEFPRPSC
jgi:hypothetical protein